ncbi:unnamed protein product, partial [Meganyctiphanes norvegica]
MLNKHFCNLLILICIKECILSSSISEFIPFYSYNPVTVRISQYMPREVTSQVEKASRIHNSAPPTILTELWLSRHDRALHNMLREANLQTEGMFARYGTFGIEGIEKEREIVVIQIMKVVIPCVISFQLYCETVCTACIENGSDHVDISGEPQFLEEIQLKYNKSAKEAGLHIVGACGYDSIPAEMGIQFMESNFPGKINSVDLYSRVRSKGGNTAINIGTLESAVLSMAEKDKIFKIRKQLFTTKLPKPKFRNEKRGAIHHNKLVNLWGVAFPLDEPVVLRTQRYKYETLGKHPIQFKGYIAAKRKLAAQSVLFGMGYIALLASNRWTRSVLLKYPEIMTRGAFKSTGGDRDALRNMTFTSTLVGKGWENVALQSSDHPAAPDKDIVVEVSGPDPGYAATSLMLVSCAMTLLREKSSCTEKGGVLTPGVAFMNTNILERLQERGMKFKVVKDPTIPSKLY